MTGEFREHTVDPGDDRYEAKACHSVEDTIAKFITDAGCKAPERKPGHAIGVGWVLAFQVPDELITDAYEGPNVVVLSNMQAAGVAGALLDVLEAMEPAVNGTNTTAALSNDVARLLSGLFREAGEHDGPKES